MTGIFKDFPKVCGDRCFITRNFCWTSSMCQV